MAAKTLTKEHFSSFVDRLIEAGRVIGVTRKEAKFAFNDLRSAADLVLDYDVTLRSPRHYFQPTQEKLFDFSTDGRTTVQPTVEQPDPFVLLGVHTYDAKAIRQMDRIWSETNDDEYYRLRREAATIVALEPTRASDWSFWGSMDAATIDSGFDLLLTDLGDRYVIEIGSEKGAALLEKHAKDATDASKDDLAARETKRAELATLCKAERKLKVGTGELSDFIKAHYENDIWEKQAEKCYSCGSCNLVCPTCYCFDVKDELELDLTNGKRTRRWDGCLLAAFAEVGSGENFREHRADRFRHRIFRKMTYVPEKLDGELACVGCGRCSSACLPDITDPVKVINEMKEGN